MTAYRATSTILAGAERAEYVSARRVASRFFETLGVGARLGRTFTDQDYAPDAAKVVILADDLWRSRYGADPQMIGRSLSLDSVPHTVIGIMPPGFWPTDSTVPQVWAPHVFSAAEKTDRKAGRWEVIARLRPGVSFDQAQTEMDLVAAQLEADYPEHNQNKGIVLVPAEAEMLDYLGSLEQVLCCCCWSRCWRAICRRGAQRK